MTQQELKPLPVRIDPVSFADHERELHGLVATKSMPRLLDNVVSAEPMATANLKISRSLHKYPLVEGTAEATVAMRCERCLDDVEIAIKTEIKVLMIPEEDVLLEKDQFEGPEHPDFHEYDGNNLVLSELIEEEILLVLPLVPKHEDISLCNQDMVVWLAANEAPAEGQDGPAKRESPFAILKSVD